MDIASGYAEASPMFLYRRDEAVTILSAEERTNENVEETKPVNEENSNWHRFPNDIKDIKQCAVSCRISGFISVLFYPQMNKKGKKQSTKGKK